MSLNQEWQCTPGIHAMAYIPFPWQILIITKLFATKLGNSLCLLSPVFQVASTNWLELAWELKPIISTLCLILLISTMGCLTALWLWGARFGGLDHSNWFLGTRTVHIATPLQRIAEILTKLGGELKSENASEGWHLKDAGTSHVHVKDKSYHVPKMGTSPFAEVHRSFPRVFIFSYFSSLSTHLWFLWILQYQFNKEPIASHVTSYSYWIARFPIKDQRRISR